MSNAHSQRFERLVAAIHQALDPDATVTWNEKIEGRQFDVTIRFKKGLHRYLTVIECKEYANPVPVEKVEAFVTKAGDARANLVVIASSSGFQSGAVRAAERHNVTLLRLTDSPNVTPLFGSTWDGSEVALHIKRIELHYADGDRSVLPETLGAMTYYTSKISVEIDGVRTPLREIAEKESLAVPGEAPLNCYQVVRVEFPPLTSLRAPNDGEYTSKEIRALEIHAGNVLARKLVGSLAYDLELLQPDVLVENILSGESQTISRQGLALGSADCFRPGKFYEHPQNGYFYYCEAIEGEDAKIYLVESFQHGDLIRAELTMNAKLSNHYWEVTDKRSIARLGRRLMQMMDMQRASARR